ncbi:DUF4270 family protein [Yeosuana sp.]|uniref:DUF4270 family protein n=1 Tax=Yeosuana sp. TaxID=2529388 RepID=UPI004049E6EE
MRIVLSFLVFLLLSCSQDSDISFFTPSNQFFDSNVNFVLIDTISFETSTFQFDSLATDIGSEILVGQYQDPVFGKIKANGYLEFKANRLTISDEAIFDSLVLNLPYKNYFYGDTLVQKNIQIFNLDEEIKIPNDQNNLFNTTSFNASELIGARYFLPRFSKDSIKITLNQLFGSSVFNQIKNGQITNQVELVDFFKGLKITQNESENSSIIAFDVSKIYLRFYYSDPDELDAVNEFDLVFNNSESNTYFTEFNADRTGTLIPVFLNQEVEMPSIASDNISFIQSGLGLTTKITFPNFRESIFNLDRAGVFFKSELKFRLNQNYINEKTFTSDSLQVFIIDQNNAFVSALGQSNGAPSKGYIINENKELNETYLVVDVNPFLENLLIRDSYLNYSLALIPYGFNNSVTRLVLNAEQNMQEKATLKITYLEYED